jgi:hypothetical protein
LAGLGELAVGGEALVIGEVAASLRGEALHIRGGSGARRVG